MSVELAVDGIFASRLAVSSADTRILLLFILLNVSNVDSYLHERLYLLFDILMNFIYENVVSNYSTTLLSVIRDWLKKKNFNITNVFQFSLWLRKSQFM